MKTSTKIVLAAALMGIVGTGAVMKAVNASPSQIANQIGVKAEKSDGDGETNDDANEQEEAKLQYDTKITPQQAQKAAETSTGAKASSVKIENEDGNARLRCSNR